VCGIGESDPCLLGGVHTLLVVHAGRSLLFPACLVKLTLLLLLGVVFGQLGLYFIGLHFNYNEHTHSGRH
jgi:hypothetical protein